MQNSIIEHKKKIRVVGAAIIDSNKLLVAQRQYSEKEYKSLKWEFPGGKIEAGESVAEAIKREIREELNCEISIDGLMPEIEYEYPDFIIQLTICICSLTSSYPICKEHKTLSWLESEELESLDWADADYLKLPDIVTILKRKN